MYAYACVYLTTQTDEMFATGNIFFYSLFLFFEYLYSSYCLKS